MTRETVVVFAPTRSSLDLTGMAELAALAAPAGIGAHAPVDPSTVGKPSDAALLAVGRLDREDASSERHQAFAAVRERPPSARR